MNDEFYLDQDLIEGPKPWFPTPSLRGQFLFGVVAVMTSGTLSAVAAVVELGQGQVQGFTTAHALGLASVVPLAFVWWVYRGVAREVDRYSLSKSSGSVFGAIALLQLLDLTEENVLPDGFDVAVWIMVGIGLIALLGFAFSAQAGAAKDPAKQTASRARWGGLGVLALIFIKVGLKFVVIFGAKGPGYHVLISLLLIVCAIGFSIWFAVCKIRLRYRLGGFAMVVGAAELLGLIGAVVFATCFLVKYSEIKQLPGFDEQALKEWGAPWWAAFAWTTVGASLGWSALHAILFMTWWTRHDPDADWLQDQRYAESTY
jgi:hypothetical protein